MTEVAILPKVDYPPMIKGSLRLMLQLKDAFLGSFNLVEEYRDQLLACKNGFTRELVVYQLTKGLAGIKRLREDLAYIETQALARWKRNQALREYLLQQYTVSSTDDPSTGVNSRIGQNADINMEYRNACPIMGGEDLPPPLNAPDSIEHALHGGLELFNGTIDIDNLDIPEEINLSTTMTENGTHLMPVVEFYRGFFFLQMHFQLIMCQAANYALPVVTKSMGLAERTFSWPTMPSFGMAATAGSMKDRLMEINTDVSILVNRLDECLKLVREKMHRDRKIESYFMHHTSAQETHRRTLLRCLQSQRVYIESLETQNDRLAGLAIKLDPKFVRSQEFALMTGPGSVFQDTGKSTSNQNSVKPDPYTFRRRDRHDRKDKDGDAGSGFPPENNVNEHNLSRSSQQRGRSAQDRRYSSNTSHLRGSGLDAQAANANTSASGGGHPPVWLQHGTLGSKKLEVVEKLGEHEEAEVDLEQKVRTLRGRSNAVEDLLIGVDSVAPGSRHPVYDEVSRQSVSYMNTENYVTSIHDDVFGPTSSPDVQGKGRQKLISQKAQHVEIQVIGKNHDDNSHSSITNLEKSESTSPFGRNSYHETNKRLRKTDEPHLFRETEIQPHSEIGAVVETYSHNLDTNVNASQLILPRILQQPQRHQPHIEKTHSRSTSTSCTSPNRQTRHGDQKRKNPTPHNRQIDKYDHQLLDRENHIHPPQQVTSVGTVGCGPTCVPDWMSRHDGSPRKSDDLLEEPKHSVFNKTMISHRCRLVESILQADEDRLEELISLLLRK